MANIYVQLPNGKTIKDEFNYANISVNHYKDYKGLYLSICPAGKADFGFHCLMLWETRNPFICVQEMPRRNQKEIDRLATFAKDNASTIAMLYADDFTGESVKQWLIDTYPSK